MIREGSRPGGCWCLRPGTGIGLHDRRDLSILGLTLTNPLTVLSFAALFVSFGVRGSTLDAAVLVAGVACGSVTWWIILTGTLARIRHRLSVRTLRSANVLSGLAVTAFGVIAILTGLRG